MEKSRNSVSRNLNALVEDRNTTQSAIAGVAGVSEGAVSLWLSGKNSPRMKYLEKIADYYKISIDDLTSEGNGLYAKLYNLTEAPPKAIAAATPKIAYAPLYGRVHAGDAEEPELLDDKIPIPYEIWERHKNGYWLEVEGTCMDRVYPPGCHIFIDPTMQPKNDSIAVVSIDGSDYIMRRLRIGANTLLLCPESHDPAWEDIVITGEHEAKMVGTVVWFQASREME